MSRKDNLVYCNDNCAWKIEAPGYKTDCAVTQIVKAIDHNSDKINDIFCSIPND